jgi:energy-coupling factor transporter ATP-binding protein EcfA2
VYVNRMRLLNVKPLHRDIPEGGRAIPEPARRRLLLQGANGSGKSTILETIFTLWKFWGEWLDEGQGSPPSEEQFTHYLAKADLAAIEFAGIPNAQPIWIGIGKPLEWRALGMTYPDAATAGMIGGEGAEYRLPGPAASVRPTTDVRWQVGPYWEIQLPQGDFLARRQRSLAGSEPFPNIVYFPPEGRTIRPPDRPRGEIIDTTRFNWTAVYDPAVNLDSILLTVKALSPERFEDCLRLVNLALEHRRKRIMGFGPKGRLVVEGTTDSGASYRHPIEELSSGERQMLLLIGFTVAFLRPGGIVLLDEPDLHLHIAMVEQLMETVERVVQERNGQLIVASHSPRVWEWFAREEEQIELSPWRGGNV